DSGEIKFTYDASCNNYGSTFAPNAIVGISEGSGVALPSSTDLSIPTVTANASIYEDFAVASTFDMMLDGIRFIPTSPGWATIGLGGPVGCAQVATFGNGCTEQNGSAFEFMAAGAFDLAGTTISYLRTGPGYTAIDSIPGVFIAPSAAATTVALGDD